MQNQVSGVLKVGAARSIVSCYIAPKLAEFVQQYPDIEVHMMNGDYMLDLLRHELDLAIHCGSLPDSNLYYKKLCIWSKATCASPAFIKKYGEPKHPSDLVNFTCLDHLYNHNRTWRYHEHGKNLWQPIRSSQRSDSSLDLKEMALNHLGFVYLPTFTVKKELESGQLINVLPAYQVPPLDMYAVYLKEKFKTKKVQAFIEFLQKQL